MKESDFLKILQKHKIDMNEKDVKEMFQYMNDDINEEFKQFSDNRTYTISGSKINSLSQS